MATPGSHPNGVSYTLYYNRFSICSIMVRWLVSIRGEPRDEASRMDITPKEIDIFNEEQLSEWYLCDVNPNGQVGFSIGIPNSPTYTDSLSKCQFRLIRLDQLTPRLSGPGPGQRSRLLLSPSPDQSHLRVHRRTVPGAAAACARIQNSGAATEAAQHQLLQLVFQRPRECCFGFHGHGAKAAGG